MLFITSFASKSSLSSRLLLVDMTSLGSSELKATNLFDRFSICSSTCQFFFLNTSQPILVLIIA